MSWLSKLTGGKPGEEKPAEEKPAEAPAAGTGREHERYQGKGERLRILEEPGPDPVGYELGDISMGGFRIVGYVGKLHGNQYVEFVLTAERDGKTVTCEGFANVVRVKDDFLAAKFTPQPRVKRFLEEVLGI